MLVKLEWVDYRMVTKLWRYVKLFSSNAGTFQTDGGMDGRTDGQTDRQNCYINIARQHRRAIKNDLEFTRGSGSPPELNRFSLAMPAKSLVVVRFRVRKLSCLVFTEWQAECQNDRTITSPGSTWSAQVINNKCGFFGCLALLASVILPESMHPQLFKDSRK